jgi:hypothetical protein
VWKISGAHLNALSVMLISYQIIVFNVCALLIGGADGKVGVRSLYLV